MKTKATIAALAMALAAVSPAAGADAAPRRLFNETAEAKEARMAWWRHDRFGMFIHFGLYAVPGRHEWMKCLEQTSEEKYDEYFRRFDPDLFDAREWARYARRAGMKYAVLTSKHHEGFCLFDSKFTDYKSTNTPFGRDIVREFVDAFRAEGLKVGFYYSLLDWHHPDFTVDRVHPRRPPGCPRWHEDPAYDDYYRRINEGRDMARYRQYMKDQVTELLTNYGKIDIIWFDFSYEDKRNGDKRAEAWDSEGLIRLARRLQPGIIVDDRLGLEDTEDGWDFVTPEQFKSDKWPERHGRPCPWETCQTFSGSWGYHRDESTWKDPKQLVELLGDTVALGGNLILNVGPTGRGDFDGRARARLDAIGEWMHRHSRAIYGCTKAPDGFTAPRGTALTYNPEKRRLYILIYDWPIETLPATFMDKVAYAQLLNDGSEVLFDAGVDGRGRFNLPVRQPDAVVPVIEAFLK